MSITTSVQFERYTNPLGVTEGLLYQQWEAKRRRLLNVEPITRIKRNDSDSTRHCASRISRRCGSQQCLYRANVHELLHLVISQGKKISIKASACAKSRRASESFFHSRHFNSFFVDMTTSLDRRLMKMIVR